MVSARLSLAKFSSVSPLTVAAVVTCGVRQLQEN
jgi:hypothetical protein